MKLVYIIFATLLSFSANASNVRISDLQPTGVESHYSHNFGIVWVNTRAVSSFNLKNSGTTPLTFKEAYIYGADYSADHSCTKGLQPNETCTFSIYYWPMFEGMSSGRFVLSFAEEDVVFDLWGEARRM